jgi:arylsulfatase B
VFFKNAKQFIKDQVKEKKPFFAWISTNAPHGPLHCPEKWSEPYKDQGKGVSNFLGMIANIDSNVGELRQLIQDEGVADNTIFIFTTDNGTAGGNKISR